MKNYIIKLSTLLFILSFVFSANAQRPTAPIADKVKIVKPSPDLIVTKVEIVPLPKKYRKIVNNKIPVQVRVTYKNIGNKMAIGKNGRKFTISLSHEKPDGSLQYLQKVKGIPAGKTFQHKFFLKLPVFYNNKTINFFAFADTYYDVKERSEANNGKKLRLKIPKYAR